VDSPIVLGALSDRYATAFPVGQAMAGDPPRRMLSTTCLETMTKPIQTGGGLDVLEKDPLPSKVVDLTGAGPSGLWRERLAQDCPGRLLDLSPTNSTAQEGSPGSGRDKGNRRPADGGRAPGMGWGPLHDGVPSWPGNGGRCPRATLSTTCVRGADRNSRAFQRGGPLVACNPTCHVTRYGLHFTSDCRVPTPRTEAIL
jgi:hypothetical protein